MFDDIIKELDSASDTLWHQCGNCGRYAGYKEEDFKTGYCHIIDITVGVSDGCVHWIASAYGPQVVLFGEN